MSPNVQKTVNLPKVGEPFDQLRRVVLVKLDIGKVHFQDGGGRISDPEKHQLSLAQMHGGERGARGLAAHGKT